MMSRKVRENFSKTEREREIKRVARRNKREVIQRKNRIEKEDMSWIVKQREKESDREEGDKERNKTPQIKRKIESERDKGGGSLKRGAKIPKTEDPPSVKEKKKRKGSKGDTY